VPITVAAVVTCGDVRVPVTVTGFVDGDRPPASAGNAEMLVGCELSRAEAKEDGRVTLEAWRHCDEVLPGLEG
jgi:hypothetical protein